jgi:hypothetical protein
LRVYVMVCHGFLLTSLHNISNLNMIRDSRRDQIPPPTTANRNIPNISRTGTFVAD